MAGTLEKMIEETGNIFLEALKKKARETIEGPKVNSQALMLSKRITCLICGAVRLDEDPVGLTCGREQCLSEIERELDEAGDHDKFIAELMKAAGPGVLCSSDLESALEDRKTMLKTLTGLAKILGVFKEKSIDDLCDDVKGSVERLKEVIEEQYRVAQELLGKKAD